MIHWVNRVCVSTGPTVRSPGVAAGPRQLEREGARVAVGVEDGLLADEVDQHERALVTPFDAAHHRPAEVVEEIEEALVDLGLGLRVFSTLRSSRDAHP